MMIWHERVLRSLFVVTSGFTALFFVIGPSRSLSRLFGFPPTQLEKLHSYFGLIVFLLALSTLVLYLWSHIARAASESTVVDSPIDSSPALPPRWLRVSLALLSILILTRVISDLDVPLDWDEHEHVTLLASPDYHRALNPLLGSENHALASLSTFGSMKLFGVNKIAARLPALLFAALFLLLLNIFATRYLAPATSVGLFASFAANEMVIYTFHQMRGYAPLFLFTTLALYFALETLLGAPRKRNLPAFAASALLAIASHTFGGLFLGILFLSLIFFLYAHRNELSARVLHEGHRLLMTSAGLLAGFAILAVFIVAHLEATGFAMAKTAPPVWLTTLMFYRPFTLFNLVRTWEIKVFFCLLAGAAAIPIVLPQTRDSDRPVWIFRAFLFTLILFFASAFHLIKFTVVEGRMLQPFLVILICVMLDSYRRIQRLPLRWISITALMLFFILPWSLHRDDSDGVPQFFADIERFVRTVKAQTAGTDRCFSFSGDPSTVGYLRHFYFHSEKQSTDTLTCRAPFHLFVEKGLFDRVSRIDAKIFLTGRVHYHDGKGRFLFEMPRPSTTLSAIP